MRLLHLLHRDIKRSGKQLQIRFQTLFYLPLVRDYQLPVLINFLGLESFTSLRLKFGLDLPDSFDILSLIKELNDCLIGEAPVLVKLYSYFT